MRAVLTFLLGVGVLLLWLGCGTACPAMSFCSDTLVVELLPPASGYPEGDYTAALTAGGDRYECAFSVVGAGMAFDGACEPRRWVEMDVDGEADLTIVWRYAAPPSVELEVSRDTELLFAETLAPTYQGVEHNQEGLDSACAQTCLEATETVALP